MTCKHKDKISESADSGVRACSPMPKLEGKFDDLSWLMKRAPSCGLVKRVCPVISDSKDELADLVKGITSSPSMKLEEEEVAIVEAAIFAPSKSMKFEVKEILSEISNEELWRFKFSCFLINNVTLRHSRKGEGLLDGEKGEIAIHASSSDASEWKGVLEVALDIVAFNKNRHSLMKDLAKEDRLVGAVYGL
ncbi:hypothetical protein FNV43_RR05811 [Rhamnella rubrinervis]|uniref:Uncharacterized protein n=1 Tax=Rhamnella rubrinervis TaxID=2594499 RepID=A0A8K0MRZ3_9ROSA|nr:hypothetical protein FNV43_RR05811 [Rhamnella rubrinervis]